jgi:hypothetical protein
MSEFVVRVNGGAETAVPRASGIYRLAAIAAALTMTEPVSWPVEVEIWVPDLLPDYGPYRYSVGLAPGSDDIYCHTMVGPSPTT